MSKEQREEHDLSFVEGIRAFMEVGEQSRDRFNAEQAGLYIGLQFEELAEKMEALAQGTISPNWRANYEHMITRLKQWSEAFKTGHHQGNILRADHEKLIDADCDLAWVSIASLFSTSINTEGALAHTVFTNLDKFEDGKAIKEENGKIKKRPGWREPDFSPYVDPTPRS